jgi:Pao retrotransposon peptidase
VLIPVKFSSEWIKIREKIKKINEITINCLARVSEKTILFGFSDASKISYRAVLYLWEPSYPEPMLVNAKTKIVPKGEKRVPQMELKAAALLLKLAEILIDTMGIKERPRLFYDSRIALAWITFHRKIKYGLAEVTRDFLLASPIKPYWDFIPTKKNPADLLTRLSDIETFAKCH